jgi:hypothetical protein
METARVPHSTPPMMTRPATSRNEESRLNPARALVSRYPGELSHELASARRPARVHNSIDSPPQVLSTTIDDQGDATASDKTFRHRVVLKSHIETIGTRIGALPQAPWDGLPFPIGMGPFGATGRLILFAAGTDIQMNEFPVDDRMDPTGAVGEYRLFSATNIYATYREGRLTSFLSTGLETDSGWEYLPPTGTHAGLAPFHAPPLMVPVPLSVDVSSGVFRWAVKGKPHAVPAAAMQSIFPRWAEYIWHGIVGRVDSSGLLTIATINSLFPSVTVFVDGKPATHFGQGYASQLWLGGDLVS